MKRYRLHDLLRAAALAYAASACSQPATSSGGADSIGSDTAEDSQLGADTLGDAVDDAEPGDTAPGDSGADAPSDAPGDAVADTGADSVGADSVGDANVDAGKDANGDTTGFAFGCTASTPIQSQGKNTGFETCASGLVHRPEQVACPPYVPDPNKICAAGIGACTTDADCANLKGGHCDMGMDSPCYCQSSCETDADCGAGQICQCGPKFGTCVQAACKDDHDCGDGLVCGFYVSNPGCNFPAFACQSPQDTCAVKSDCAPQEECTWDTTTGHRFCSPGMCAIGRPFAVDGNWRTAGLQAREDWTPADARPVAVPEALRPELAAYWLEAAQMEHASVASFARLTLELMAVGAPPDLLIRAQQAGLDEVRHAQRCFELARALGAGAHGPGALPIDASLRQPVLAVLAADAAREGCVWETTAALEARVAAQACTLPDVRAALTVIAEDEANHADLAWAIVAWALESGGASVREAVATAMDEAEAELLARDVGADLPDGLGVLRGAALRRLRAHALHAVVQPARARLFGQPAAATRRRKTVQA